MIQVLVAPRNECVNSPCRRVELRGADLLSLTNGRFLVRAAAGRGWLSHGGRDVAVGITRDLLIDARQDPALVSPLGHDNLLLEVREL